MPEPNPQDVANFREFTGAGQQTAIDFLKKYTSTNTAISQYFENGGILPVDALEGWDESAFHADRNVQYGPENKSQPTFNVHGSDTLNANIFQPTPSRPPSRVSTYASQSGADDATKTTSALWVQGSGTQESGVINSAGQQFRKVDKAEEYYDTHSWAMTVPTFTEREYVQNPEPNDRGRQPGAPVFLRPLPAAHYLPALLTILHAIPMAKEALLGRDFQIPDYGTSSDWWDGNPIPASKVFYVDTPTSSTEVHPSETELIVETQRLMAFLENSERAYGSVQNLLRSSSVRNGANRPAADFLKTWQDAMRTIRPNDPLKDIFTSVAVNDPLEAAKGQPQAAKLTEFEIPVTQQMIELGGSLYDALDEMVWPEYDGDAIPSVHVQVGEILVARVSSSDRTSTGIGLDIPAEFYPDRYLESSINPLQKMRTERVSLLHKVNQITNSQAKLALVANPQNPSHPVSGIALVDLARSFFDKTPERETTLRSNSREEMLVDIEPEPRTFKYGDVAEELKQLLLKVGLRHQSLEQAKEAAMERVREVTKAYREPDTHPDPTDLHRYTLRGVSTDPSTVYVLANPNTAEDLLDTAVDDWQWWRINFDQSMDRPAQCDRVNREDVLKAAKTDSDEVLLVYGSDKAVSYTSKPLAGPLRNFVRTDNLAFARELQEGTRRSTPTKRKASALSEDFAWNNSDDGRVTPVNITVSDDEDMGEPPPYDSVVAPDKSMDSWPKTDNDDSHDLQPTKFPEYEEVDLLSIAPDEGVTTQATSGIAKNSTEALGSITLDNNDTQSTQGKPP